MSVRPLNIKELLDSMPKPRLEQKSKESNYNPPVRKHRKVEDVLWARRQRVGPFRQTTRGRTDAQKKGIRFENRVARDFLNRFNATVTHGQWIEFEDSGGYGWAQPDLILDWPGSLLIIECKLTLTSHGVDQLLDTYLPLLRHMEPSRPIGLVQVCRAWSKKVELPRVARIQDVVSSKGTPQVYGLLRLI